MPRRHRRRAALRIGVSKQYPRSAPLNRGRAIGTVPVVARHFRHCSPDQRVARTGKPPLIAKYPMEYPNRPFKDQATEIGSRLGGKRLAAVPEPVLCGRRGARPVNTRKVKNRRDHIPGVYGPDHEVEELRKGLGRGLHGTRAGAVPRSHNAAPADPLAEVLPVLDGLESFRKPLIPTFVAACPRHESSALRGARGLGKLAACR
jgi:hypothetical protein